MLEVNINEDIKLEKSKQNHWRTGGFVFLTIFSVKIIGGLRSVLSYQ